ncbi:MAG: aromatic-ring-hydroxylating dioxygenase subunit beta [Alicyclobacillus sp.]|nr:aromatic-ring-hydroxylating dioxygenase subunit beta [Alicyclobacillus sp.]
MNAQGAPSHPETPGVQAKRRPSSNPEVILLLAATDRNVREAIVDLLNEYVHCIDDDRLEEWPSYFSERCLYQIISRENFERQLPVAVMYCDSRGMLTDRIQSLREANVYEHHRYRHLLSSPRWVQECDGVWTVHTNYAVFRTTQEGDSHLYNTGKYIDRVVQENGRWVFLEKTVVFDTLRIPTLLVIPI